MARAVEDTDETLMDATAVASGRPFGPSSTVMVRVCTAGSCGPRAPRPSPTTSCSRPFYPCTAPAPTSGAGRSSGPGCTPSAPTWRREHFRRAQRRAETAFDPQAHDSGVAPDATTPEVRAVRRALQELPDNQRDVLLLHWYEGFTFPEIGKMLGASTSAVKVRAHRAYKALRASLSEE